jgi:hypothetical protein
LIACGHRDSEESWWEARKVVQRLPSGDSVIKLDMEKKTISNWACVCDWLESDIYPLGALVKLVPVDAEV